MFIAMTVLSLLLGVAAYVPHRTLSTATLQFASSELLELHHAVVSGAKRASRLLVNLHNASISGEITDVKVSVRNAAGQELTTTEIGVLRAGQSVVKEFALPFSLDDCYIVTSFRLRGLENAVAQGIPTTPKASFGASSIAPLASLLGVFLGAALAHVFVTKQAVTRAGFEWSKMLFERYESAYRQFLATWGGVPSAVLLEGQFSTLRANALVPLTTIRLYEKAISILRSGASATDKQNACDQLVAGIHSQLSKPWSLH